VPYTLSHPAAVLLLGLKGRGRDTRAARLPLAAAVAGSMAPDIPYYLRSPVMAVPTHSLAGLFTVDLLLGLAMYFLWVGLILGPALWLAPHALQRRVPTWQRATLGMRLQSVTSLLAIVGCVLFGAATHLLWDSFTHSGMWATNRWPALNNNVSGHTVYTWLQFTSSIAGMLLIGWAMVRWWWRTPPSAPVVPGRPALRALTAIALLVLPVWASLVAFGRYTRAPLSWGWLGERATQGAIIAALLRGTACALSLILLVAVVWHCSGWLRKGADRLRSPEAASPDAPSQVLDVRAAPGRPFGVGPGQRGTTTSRTSH
jgi:hypothetical protein